jgi:hypothetical protein
MPGVSALLIVIKVVMWKDLTVVWHAQRQGCL